MSERNKQTEKKMERIDIVAFPFPGQGHINPMLQFCRCLASKGLKVTLISFIDDELTKSMKNSLVRVESISNYDEDSHKFPTMEGYWQNKKSRFERKLVEMTENNHGSQISCLVYDSIMPWALDIARQFGIAGAAFFTQACCVSAIYLHVHQGKLNIPMENQESISLAGLPILESHDLPAIVPNYASLVTLRTSQFANLKEADWVFINSFDTLEQEVLRWMTNQFSVKLIGPTIPSMYLDEKLEDHSSDYGLNLVNSVNNNCIPWLDSKKNRSVIYVSFGSLAALAEKQMEEIAKALTESPYHFLWVVRESEENKLPKTFLEATEKGMVVSWCSQLEVLAHKSVGCYITHCGWNSTLEALSLGVPMVAMPNWTDQTTNAKFVADVWKVGVRVKVDEEGIVTKDAIENCIREVMDGEIGNEMRMNSEKWKKLAKEAIDEGGSSHNNIEEFVAKFKCCSNIETSD
ncbi:UDP glycosyltransferase 9-like [Mercurialis annua]|uniref:UDP glycosyltransferase 9-like n=1 Tax=Mercurialis annua TaxID=3986 RepID=UPI00215FF4A2|nr:UDP glycosyltransferase 9-like [Mercurialis annua]